MTKTVMITGTHSGVCKTTVALGLMALFTRRGKGIFDGHDGLMAYNTLASYLHAHPAAVSMEKFVNSCRKYSR